MIKLNFIKKEKEKINQKDTKDKKEKNKKKKKKKVKNIAAKIVAYSMLILMIVSTIVGLLAI